MRSQRCNVGYDYYLVGKQIVHNFWSNEQRTWRQFYRLESCAAFCAALFPALPTQFQWPYSPPQGASQLVDAVHLSGRENWGWCAMTHAKLCLQSAVYRSFLIACFAILISVLLPSASRAQQSSVPQTCEVQTKSCCNTCGSCDSGPSCPAGYTIYDDYCLPECPSGLFALSRLSGPVPAALPSRLPGRL